MDELKISLGTKNSVVDVARSHAVADTLREMGHDVEIVHIPAAGDSETVGQLRLGLMRGDFDLVVHRMHRIPKQDMPGLTFAAILKRGDPHRPPGGGGGGGRGGWRGPRRNHWGRSSL